MRKKFVWTLSALALVVSTVLVYAAASYPSATKSFTTKTDGPGQTIFAAHINDLQDEVVAIENALLSGFAHVLKPLSDATYDLGTSSLKWRDAYLSRNATIGGTLTVTGAGTHTGVATFTAQSVHNAGVDLSGASAGQIVFPATQNPSTNVNTLDDYEEGTWTPVLGGSGGTSGQTYTTQVGSYVKVGKLVHAYGYIVLSAKGTITGNCQIQGLPFTQENTANLFASGSISYWATLATNWVFLTVQGINNSTAAGLWGLKAAGATLIQPVTADINDTSQLIFSITYRATQ